jgi:DNA polymerase III epsilon subunit-like protein
MTTRVIPPPVRRQRILVFDVETTGLLPKQERGKPIQLEKYPHILQMSFVEYDLCEHKLIQSTDAYIKIDDKVEISQFVRDMTGITNEVCQERGVNFVDVLDKFYDAYNRCDVLVAHNMEFDEKMIMIEIERNRRTILEKMPYCLTLFNPIFEKVKNIERYCTMKKGTSLCNLEMKNSNIPEKKEGEKEKKPMRKWPRLNELYSKLFDGEVPVNLHNSIVDVYATLRCYLKMRHEYNFVIPKV